MAFVRASARVPSPAFVTAEAFVHMELPQDWDSDYNEQNFFSACTEHVISVKYNFRMVNYITEVCGLFLKQLNLVYPDWHKQIISTLSNYQ